MSIITTDDKHYKAIADAIRLNANTDQTFTPEEMSHGVQFAHDAGYLNGWDDGTQNGIKSEYDRFWDAYQENGNRRYYTQAFGGPWTAEIFRPKYDLAATGASAYGMFRACLLQGSLKQILTNAGVSLTFDRCSNIGSLFQEANNLTEIGELDFSTVTHKSCTALFSSCPVLKTIEKIILPVGQTTFSTWFYKCKALENVVFEGTISANNLDVSATKLTRDSLMSIINCLADYSGTSTKGTVTFGAALKDADGNDKLTTADIAIATQKGWTIV